MNMMKDNTNADENVLAGIVGALLFSLAGGIVWFIFWQVGVISAISGLVGVFCAIKGYSIFAKKESIKGLVIAIIFSVAVIVLAWYLCIVTDIYNAYQEWYAEGYIDYTITFSEAVGEVSYWLSDETVSSEYISNLVVGLLFCVIGGIGLVIKSVKRVKAAKANSDPMNASEPQYTEYSSAQYNDDAFIGEGRTYTRLNGEVDDLKE